ncbi:MAG: hypothetical protein C4522_07590 [Desulfobacteraceae bacterium]|nr:MAG: hypothetical protein C4522_07590 [Desulfobacteraceae bacterium]
MSLNHQDKRLINCLSGDPRSAGQLQNLTISEWDSLVRQSKEHLVAPFLYKHLQGIKEQVDIPGEVMQKLYSVYINCAARNVKMECELQNALQGLVKSNTPFILLKGAHLNGIVYSDPGLRSMEDVDILFRKEDLKRGQECLLKAGYLNADERLVVDVHWYLEQYLDLDMNRIWDMARPVVIAGVHALVLSPEHLIVHLCMHLSFHHQFRFAGLRTFCDIRETIKRYPSGFNWKEVIDYSEECSIRNGVYLTLFLAKTLTGAMVPEDVLENLKPVSFREEYGEWAIDQIFHKNENEPSLSPYFWQIWKTDSWITKGILFLKLMIPTREFLSQKYPSSIHSGMNLLYYVVRMKDHLKRYTGFFWRVMIREDAALCLIREKKYAFHIMEWISAADNRLP